jgi:hypothetical protein
MSYASRSFQSNKESVGAGDYIFKKKVQATKCVASFNKCGNIPPSPSPLNRYKYNLNMNLFTTLDLTSVEVVEDSASKDSPTLINKVLAANFYNNYVIDPKGQLFGNTRCGYKNFLFYLKNNN